MVKNVRRHLLLKAVSFAAVLSVIAGMFAANLCVSAAAYNGKGTKKDPYLVQNFEQLQGMKDNLSAHYKLDNTIDCSGKTLSPIGNLNTPFTGSFTCDADSDGTPKYAIMNLSVSVAFGNYVKNKSGWEAGLFGCTSGASITNIAVINCNISSEVLGLNQMNADWSRNSGQDEQATAALIGIAKKTTVKGCMSSGNINSKSNHCGGLIGRADNCDVSYSYSTATVTSSGLWCHGGLIGTFEGGSVKFSYSTGAVKSLASSVGGLIGSASGALSDCYSTGSVGTGARPPEYGSLYGFGDTRPEPKSCKNSFALGAVTGLSDAPTAATNTDNCYILNSAGCAQKGFQPASQSEINAKFGSLSGWKMNGSTPTIADIAVISDTSKYTPRQITDTPTAENNNTAGGDSASQADTESGADETVKMTAAELTDEVNKLAEKLMNKNELSEEEAFRVLELKRAYEDMDESERTQVEAFTVKSLDMLYEESVNRLIVILTEEIEKLPDPDKVTAENAEQVLNVYEKFQKLPEDVRENFSKKNLDKLEACYKKAKEFEGVSIVTQKVSNGFGALEWTLTALLGLLNLAALGGVGYMVFLNVKTSKQIKKLTADSDAADTESEEFPTDE